MHDHEAQRQNGKAFQSFGRYVLSSTLSKPFSSVQLVWPWSAFDSFEGTAVQESCKSAVAVAAALASLFVLMMQTSDELACLEHKHSTFKAVFSQAQLSLFTAIPLKAIRSQRILSWPKLVSLLSVT
jgi:hypothetical protein